MTVIGLDLSMTSTGIAKIRQSHSGLVVTTLSVKSKGKRGDTLLDRVARIDRLTADITQSVDASVNLAILESPSYGSAGSGTWDRAGLWWRVVTWLWKQDVPVALCAPTTLKKWIAGNGRADKKAVQSAVEALFPDVKLATNDEADALALCHAGAFYLDHDKLPLVEGRHTKEALAAVKWPLWIEGSAA